MYASAARCPFLADTNRQAAYVPIQNSGAFVITGNPSGSPALETCRNANLLLLDLLARKEAAKLCVRSTRPLADRHNVVVCREV